MEAARPSRPFASPRPLKSNLMPIVDLHESKQMSPDLLRIKKIFLAV